MEKILKRNYLLCEVLSYLTYIDIAKAREISKRFKEKIDNVPIWEQLVKRDYPDLIYIEEISSIGSLEILTGILKHKRIVPKNDYTVGVIGILGELNTYINEPQFLMRTGFLGSLRDYASNSGVNRISLVSIPNVTQAIYQIKLINMYLLLVNSFFESWEEKLKLQIEEFRNEDILKLVIIVNTDKMTELLIGISQEYSVVTVRDLTMENVKRVIATIDKTVSNKNIQKRDLPPEAHKKIQGKNFENFKKKCHIF